MCLDKLSQPLSLSSAVSVVFYVSAQILDFVLHNSIILRNILCNVETCLTKRNFQCLKLSMLRCLVYTFL